MQIKKISRGFTLIELLIVIAIIAIIAAVVFVALDPLTRFKDARDTQRWNDVTSLLGAIKIDQVDNAGSYLTAIADAADGTYKIGTAATGCADACTAVTPAAACINLTGLVTEGYLGEIPTDPTDGTATETDYYLIKAATGMITIGACDPENASGGIYVAR